MTLNYIYWDINPEIVNVFGISLRYYGLLFAGGLVLCGYILKGIFVKETIPVDHFQRLTMYALIGIFAGARLGHCLFYEPEYFLSHPLEMLLPIQPKTGGGYEFTGYQGLASHGGTIGLMIAIIAYTIKTKEKVVKTFDLIAIVAPLGGSFIRLANLMNSEIIGMTTTKPWGFIFAKVDSLPRHPAQLYEAIAYLLMFWLLYCLFLSKRLKTGSGIFFGLSLVLIFTARFLIEFVKERQVAFEESMKLDMGQLLSLPFILIGIVFIFYGLSKKKTLTSDVSATNSATRK